MNNTERLHHYQNIEKHPFVGTKWITPPIKAKIKDADHIRPFFDGTPGYDQRNDATIGKEYEIYAVEGFGDVADAFFTGDDGKETSIMIDFFET